MGDGWINRNGWMVFVHAEVLSCIVTRLIPRLMCGVWE